MAAAGLDESDHPETISLSESSSRLTSTTPEPEQDQHRAYSATGEAYRRRPSTHSASRLPVVVRIVWEHDGEEHIATEALGWSNSDAYVRLPRQPVAVHRRVARRQRRETAQPFLVITEQLRPWSTRLPGVAVLLERASDPCGA